MKAYTTAQLRNVGIFSHGGSGKTSLAEAMLFTSKATNRIGRVDEGNTVSDYDPDEQKRHISVQLTVAPVTKVAQSTWICISGSDHRLIGADRRPRIGQKARPHEPPVRYGPPHRRIAERRGAAHHRPNFTNHHLRPYWHLSGRGQPSPDCTAPTAN
jgi:hypothetical protein